MAFLVLELWFPFHFLLPVKKKKLYISVSLNIEFYVALIFSRGISISKFGDRLDILIGYLDFRLEYKSGILISDRNYFPLKSEWRYTMINQKLLPLNLSILDES